MKITADTEISSLMNAEAVSGLCDDFTSKVDSFKESASSDINSEMTAGLSGENCLVAGQALLEEEATKTLSSISGIDTGVTSKIVQRAKQKRIEELVTLRFQVTLKISNLGAEKRNLLDKASRTLEQEARLTELNKEIDKYEKKLNAVNAELGRLR